MNTIELFSGTKSFSKVAEELGHETLTIDNNKDLNPDVCVDILNYHEELGKLNLYPKDILWASPPCTSFSIASVSHHWTKIFSNHYYPKSNTAEVGQKLLLKTVKIISDTKPKIWFIENPRGGLRKMDFMQQLNRYTVTYCSYGDMRNKPTDIWTNHPNPKFKPLCTSKRKGTINDCKHEKAPRGSRTGTQGLKGSKERSVIPNELCRHIVEICERGD